MTTNNQVQRQIEGCLSKDKASQMAIYKHFYNYAMGVCLRFSRNREEAMEILNDGFLKAFTKIDRYDPSFPFKPWLRRVLINASIDHYRKYNQGKEEFVRDGWPTFTSISYNEALYNLVFEDLRTMTKQLPPAYRQVFNLYVIEGMSHQEISEEVKISVGASKSNLFKARKKLNEIKTKACYF